MGRADAIAPSITPSDSAMPPVSSRSLLPTLRLGCRLVVLGGLLAACTSSSPPPLSRFSPPSLDATTQSPSNTSLADNPRASRVSRAPGTGHNSDDTLATPIPSVVERVPPNARPVPASSVMDAPVTSAPAPPPNDLTRSILNPRDLRAMSQVPTPLAAASLPDSPYTTSWLNQAPAQTLTLLPGLAGYRYVAEDRSFTAIFPAEPTVDDVPVMKAVLDHGDRFYFVRSEYANSTLPPVSITEAQDYLDWVVLDVVRQFGAQKIDYREALLLNGRPGRRLIFANAKGIQFEARAYFDPWQLRLIVIAFGTRDDNLAVPEAQQFFESFQLGEDMIPQNLAAQVSP